MINWDEMTMTAKAVDGEANVYRFQVANDIAMVRVNLRQADYFEDIHLEVVEHFIGHRGNKPTNPGRTCALMRRIHDEVRRMYLKELEEMWKELTEKPVSEDNKLQEDYIGKRVTFWKGTSNREIFLWFSHHYGSTCAAGDFYDLVLKYVNTEGLMSYEIKDWFDI